MTAEAIRKLLLQLLSGMGVSLEIFILTLVFSIPLGILVTVGRLSRSKILSGIVKVYITIMRGTPLILQLYFFYFVPCLMLQLRIDKMVAIVFAMAINYAAYFAEIFRGGYQSIPSGLKEAGKVLGFTKTQVFFSVSLPLVTKRVLPPFAGEVITLVKDTALVSALGVLELYKVAQNATNRIVSPLPLVIAGVFYFVFNAIVSKGFSLLEKKLDYYKF